MFIPELAQDEYFTTLPFSPDFDGVETARVDAFAIGTGSTPMPKARDAPGANELTNEVFRATVGDSELSLGVSPNDPSIAVLKLDLVFGLQRPLGETITEMALIVSDPQDTTDADGNSVDQIVVQYEYGNPTQLGDPDGASGNPNDPVAGGCTLSLPLNADFAGES